MLRPWWSCSLALEGGAGPTRRGGQDGTCAAVGHQEEGGTQGTIHRTSPRRWAQETLGQLRRAAPRGKVSGPWRPVCLRPRAPHTCVYTPSSRPSFADH